MRDKRAFFYKHDRLTPKQDQENEALVNKLVREREEKEKESCPKT